MNFYSQIIDSKKEFDYFLYLIEELNDLELQYKEVINQRDSKLKLILYNDFDKLNNHFLSCFENYKADINKMALDKLVIEEMEELGRKIDYFAHEINVVFEETDIVKIEFNRRKKAL